MRKSLRFDALSPTLVDCCVVTTNVDRSHHFCSIWHILPQLFLGDRTTTNVYLATIRKFSIANGKFFIKVVRRTYSMVPCPPQSSIRSLREITKRAAQQSPFASTIIYTPLRVSNKEYHTPRGNSASHPKHVQNSNTDKCHWYQLRPFTGCPRHFSIFLTRVVTQRTISDGHPTCNLYSSCTSFRRASRRSWLCSRHELSTVSSEI